MAQDPYLYWYPAGSRTLATVQLGFVSDLRPVDTQDAEEVLTGNSAPYRSVFGRARIVPIVKERFTSASLRRDLEAVVNHLRAGGVVGFSLDDSKALAKFGTPPQSGDTVIALDAADPWGSWPGTPAFASGDEIRIEQPGRTLRAETVTYSSLTSSDITVSAVRNTYDTGPVLVRYRDFYPVLRLPAGLANSPDLLTHDRRLNYTLSLPLVEYPADLWAFWEAGVKLGSKTDSPFVGGRFSADEFLGQRATSVGSSYPYTRVDRTDNTFRTERFEQPSTGIIGIGKPGWLP